MVYQRGYFGVAGHDSIGELDRVRRGVTNPLDARHQIHQVQQLGEINDFVQVVTPTKGIHVLPEQVDLFDTAVRQTRNFSDDIVDRPRDLLAAGVGHHAKRAVLAAALHDRHKCSRALDTGLRQAIKFLDLGEADIDDNGLSPATIIDHLRQSVQGLRTKDQIDIGRPFADFGAFLAGHTPANADDQIRILLFQVLPPAQLMKDFFLRFFPNGAGVEQQHVCLIG